MAIEKNGNVWTRYLVWLAGGLIAAGGLAACVRANTDTLSKHDTRISANERVGTVVETQLKSLAADVGYIRRKLDRLEP